MLEREVAAAYVARCIQFRRRPRKVLRWAAHFDSAHLYLDMSDGRAVSFPQDWFPVLQAATAAEREHFAISMDRQQLFWPEIDEDVNVPTLSFQSEYAARQCDSPEGRG